MKKVFEIAFLIFWAVFMGAGAISLWRFLQVDPDVASSAATTKAIQEQFDAISAQRAPEQSIKSSSNNTYCQRVAYELANTGKLSSLSENPSCISWTIPTAYSQQNESVIADLKQFTRAKAAKELDRELSLIEAFYTDREVSLKQDYNRVQSKRNNDLISGQITEGQHNYFTSTDKANYLEKMIDNKQRLISAMYAEINKKVDVKALYAKYNLPVDTGANTLKAISGEASDLVEKSIFLALSDVKSK